MKTLLMILKPFKAVIIAAILLGFIAGFGRTILIVIISKANFWHIHEVFFNLYMFLLLVGAVFAADFGSSIALNKISQKSIYNLQDLLCNKILNLPLAQLEKLGKSQLYAILTQDIMIIVNFAGLAPIALINIVTVIGGLVCVGMISMRMLLIIVTILVMMSFFFIELDRKIVNVKFEKARDLIDRLFKALQGLLDGAKELRLNQQQRSLFMAKGLLNTAKEGYKNNYSAMTWLVFGYSIWQSLFYLLLGVLIFLPASFLRVDESVLLQCITIIVFTISPLITIANILPNLRRSLVSAKKISELEIGISDFSMTSDKVNVGSVSGDYNCLKLNDVVYAYSEGLNENFTLGPLSMTLKSGEIVFLVGKNGSGKSTLVKIISGLYKPQRGQILLNGSPITDDNIIWFREHFSVIFYDFYLFDRSILCNMSGNDPRIIEYSKKLQIEKLVKSHGEEISIASVNFVSDGERRRLAFLNLYLENRPFCVFDEPASDQDPEFKTLFYDYLLKELKRLGKSILVISHDSNYFKYADRIIYLQEGKIHLDEGSSALS